MERAGDCCLNALGAVTGGVEDNNRGLELPITEIP